MFEGRVLLVSESPSSMSAEKEDLRALAHNVRAERIRALTSIPLALLISFLVAWAFGPTAGAVVGVAAIFATGIGRLIDAEKHLKCPRCKYNVFAEVPGNTWAFFTSDRCSHCGLVFGSRSEDGPGA